MYGTDPGPGLGPPQCLRCREADRICGAAEREFPRNPSEMSSKLREDRWGSGDFYHCGTQTGMLWTGDNS